MTQEEFSKLDTDGNGLVSCDELKAAHQKHRKQRADADRKRADAG